MWYIRSYYKDEENIIQNLGSLGSYVISDLKTLRGVKNRINKYILKRIEEEYKLMNKKLYKIEIYRNSNDGYGGEILVETISY